MTQPDAPTPPLRIAIWCAVSSKPQASDDKISLADQEASGRAFAAAIQGHVVRVYTVPGHTRDLIFWDQAAAEMDAYRQLREDCEGHAFDVLYALDPDRLGRDSALINQVISLVNKHAEIYLASAPHPIGQSSTGQRYVYAIQAIRAEEDQHLRTHRLMGGIAARVRRGLPANHWPTGYIPVPGPDGAAESADIDPDLAPAIELITTHFLAGDTYRTIIRALEASPYHAPRAIRWNYATVHKITHSDFYAGFPSWGDVTCPEPSPHYPHLWDPDTHAAIIRERARRNQFPHQKTQGSPLAGTVFCARCGYQMTRHLNHNHRYALRCSKHNKAAITGEPCHCNYVNESVVVAALAQFLQQISTPAAIDAALHKLDLATPLADQLARVDRHLEDLAARRQRLALALAAGQMDVQIYRQADDRLLVDVDVLNRERQDLQTQLAAAPSIEDRRAALQSLASIFPDIVVAVPAPRIRTLLANAGIRIEIENGEVSTITLSQ